ncbi:MAG TPA: hypothetical protein VK087_00215 [Tissierellaceae bacterium]|nr:hypothetical protein [Tissierellaceae bacterium]
MGLNKLKKRKSYPKSNYHKPSVIYPGERVEIDVKHVPNEYIGFASHHSRYYQITASTSNFLTRLEDKLGFQIKLVQTDNGIEFVNDQDITNKKIRFEKYLENLDIKHKRTLFLFTIAKRNSRA